MKCSTKEFLKKCGGCGAEDVKDLQIVFDKKKNRGYLCSVCRKKYHNLLQPDSARNFWMCGACHFRILAGTDIDSEVDELDNQCPNCDEDVMETLVNLNQDQRIKSGMFGEPLI